VRCHAIASSFVAKVRGEVFARFHPVAVKHSRMRNWLFGLPGRIICEQSSWCRRKLWVRFWLCSSPVSSFFESTEASIPFQHPCTPHAFFPEHLSTFPEIYTKYDAHYLCIAKSRQARYTTPNKRMQKPSTSSQFPEILYTDSQDMLALSLRYYNGCTEDSTSPENYGW
jgi:hypothetical protein